MIKIIPFIFLIFGGLTFFTMNHGKRNIASLASDKTEAVRIKLSERTEIIILGIDDRINPANQVKVSDISKNIIFKTSDYMTPKFMFTLLDEKVKEVYSFELKRKRTSTYEAQESINTNRWYVKIDFDDKFLPKKLLDLDKVKRDSVLMSTVKLIHNGLLLTEYAAISILLNKILTRYEDIKSYQASYLERLVRLELFERKVPILTELFGEDNLWQIGAGLNLRYHSDSDFASFFVAKRNMVDLYRKYRKVKEEEYFITMSKLIERSNEEGLLTVPLTSDFAIVYGFKNKEYYENFSNFLVSVENPTNMIESLEEHELDAEGLIPLGIFSARQSSTPMTVVDFNNIGKNTKKNSLVSIIEVGKEIGFEFLSFSMLSIGLQAIDGAIRFVNLKSGETVFEHRVYSDAEFDLLLDTGFLELSNHNILKGALDKQLEAIDITRIERNSILSDLQSADKQVQNNTISKVVKKFGEEERDAKLIDFGDHYEKSAYRLKNWFGFKAFLNTESKIKKFLEQFEKRESFSPRKPASAKLEFEKPVVMLLIDGLRPDRLKDAAKKGLVPVIKKLFMEEGHEFNSYVTRSLTLPSWGTIFTGHTPDEHGVRSNTPITRDFFSTKGNYTDVRKDLVSIMRTGNNRSLLHLKESHVKWLGDYYKENETITNYMPYSRGLNLPFKKIGKLAINNLDEIFYGSFGGALGLDLASMDQTISEIQKYPGRFKLVMNWFASVDSASHHNNESLDVIYQEIDKSIGKMVETLKNDPVLKEAHIILVSDHGMRGGHEHKGSDLNLFEEDSFLKNTSFNLTTFFTGNYFSHRDYGFVVKTFESPRPKHDLFFLKEFQLHPFEYIYRGKNNNPGPPNIMLDTSGDALAQIYIVPPSGSWEERPSYYNLTNYELKGKKLNLIKDLFKVELKSVVSPDQNTRIKLFLKTGFKPIEFFGTWLKNDNEVEKLKKKLNISYRLSREPVIIQDETTGAIIFSAMINGVEKFKYIPVSRFGQNMDGTYFYNLENTQQDIFGYKSINDFDLSKWYTDRQLLNIFKNHKYPNAIIGVVKLLTLNRTISANINRQSERPDFILMAKPGFNFNSSYSTEGDHGSIERAQVKNSLFMTKLGDKDQFEYKASETPVMSKDIVPSILKINGFDENSVLWKAHWDSLFKESLGNE